MKKEKIMYLDVARILATIAVVLVHVASMEPNWTNYEFSSPEWGVFCSYAAITKWAAPIFCLISGALFLDPDRNVPTKKLYTHNIPRIITSLVFWSCVYVVNLIVMFNIDFTRAEFIKRVAGGYYHQWYLYMIIGFYILVPVLRKITADKQLTKYITAVTILFHFVVPFIQFHPKFDWTTAVTNKMFISLPGYLAYFLLGYYINKFDLSKLTKSFIYVGGVVSFVFTVTQTLAKTIENDAYYNPYTNYNSVTVLIQTVFIFVLIKDVCGKINFNKNGTKTISTLSKDTFAIYQMHPLIIMLLTKYLGFTSTSALSFELPPIVAIPLLLLITYVISELASHILNKIPIVKKYLV